jgi:histidinol-phosphate aminotransferase
MPAPRLPADWLRPAVRAVSPYAPGEQPDPGRRVIKLNTNENPYPPSPRVLEALTAALDGDLRLYPDPEARGLRARAAELYGVPMDHVMAGNGSDELLALLLRATIDPGARVAYPVPTYSLYDTLVAVQGGEAIRVPFPADFTLPALARTGARVTFLCNPNSPSGTFIPVEQIGRLAEHLPGVLVVDEAYVDFARDHALRLIGRHPNVVVLRTLSKSYSLAGLRVGLLAGHPDLLAGVRAVKDSYNVNRLSLAAGEAALADVEAMQTSVARVRATREVLTAGLERLGRAVLPSEANFVLTRRPGVDQAPVARELAVRGILVRHFAMAGLDDALRISVGTDEEIAVLLDVLRAIGG